MQGDELRTLLERDGFVCIKNVLSEQDLQDLRRASESITHATRNGQWPYLRSLPKQFPPWSSDPGKGIWGVQHLLHPNISDRGVFAGSYFNEKIIQAVIALLDCSREDLVLELYNLLTRPDHDFALRWHRDNIGPEVSAEEELKQLQQPMLHAQWNLALYQDESLIVIPGSHKRARTDVERLADPFENDMAGQVVVKLAAGDAVFYDNNILHRGVYTSTTPRMTLHGSMGTVGDDPARARVILQHGIGEWVGACDFSELRSSTRTLAKSMKQNLLAIGTGKDYGFAQQD